MPSKYEKHQTDRPTPILLVARFNQVGPTKVGMVHFA